MIELIFGTKYKCEEPFYKFCNVESDEVKFFDNGIDIEYEDMEIKNTEINKEILKNYEMMEKINLFRIFLIKNYLNKKA